MRLGQLARKLNVRTAEITEFLAQHNMLIDEGSNVRLQEDQVMLIVKHFDTANAAFFLTEKEESEVQIEPIEKPKETVEDAPAAQVLIEPTTISEVDPEKPEVIRAPKVELSGLKVLGKINLPEKKKKEGEAGSVEEQPVAPESGNKSVRQERRPFRQQKNRNDKSYKNPVAPQREREAREAEKVEREQQKQRKEKRTQYYQNRVKSAPTKPVKKVEEPLVEIEESDTTGQLSRWKRFIRWWNT